MPLPIATDPEHARFYRSVPLNAGLEDFDGVAGWVCTQDDAIAVVRRREDPPWSMNGDRAWREPWPPIDAGGENYLVAAPHSVFVLGHWAFPMQVLQTAGITAQRGRIYGGSVRVYFAPGDGGVSVRMARMLCQADMDLGGLELATFDFSTIPSDGDPWPIGKWSRIEIPAVECDIDDPIGLHFMWTGPGQANKYGPIGIDDLVLVDVTPGPRRDLL